MAARAPPVSEASGCRGNEVSRRNMDEPRLRLAIDSQIERTLLRPRRPIPKHIKKLHKPTVGCEDREDNDSTRDWAAAYACGPNDQLARTHIMVNQYDGNQSPHSLPPAPAALAGAAEFRSAAEAESVVPAHMLRPAPAIPRMDLAVRFAASLIRDCPSDDIYVQIQGAYIRAGRNALIEPARSRKHAVVVGGYFDRLPDLLYELWRVRDLSIYIAVNPILRVDRGRLRNRLGRVESGDGVSTADVRSIRHIIVDIDPAGREPGENSSDAQHRACIDLMREILDREPEIAQCARLGSSGNGSYILIRTKPLENVPENRDGAKALIRELARRYSSQGAEIDAQTDPTKKLGLPGSIKAKGAHSPDRPRRIVGMGRLNEPIESLGLHAWLAEKRESFQIWEPRYLEAGASTTPIAASAGPARKGKALAARIAAARERMRTYPPARSGDRGFVWTIRAGCYLADAFDLEEAAILEVLREWNARNLPPWTESELRRAVGCVMARPESKKWKKSYRNPFELYTGMDFSDTDDPGGPS